MGYELVDLLDRIGDYNSRLRGKYVDAPDTVPYGGNELALIITDIHRALWAINDKLEVLSDE